MAQGKVGGAWAGWRQTAIMRNTLARPERQFQSALQVKKGYRAVLEFFADNAFGWKTQAIPIEINRPFQVVNAEGNYRNTRLHVVGLLQA
jgi:hypothetical protein